MAFNNFGVLLQKGFWRRKVSPVFDVRHLAVDVLGCSPMLVLPDLNRKVKAVAQRLLDQRIIALPPGVTDPAELVQRLGRGDFRVQFVRGGKLGWLWRAGPTAAVPPGQRDSDVSRQAKRTTNAGTAMAAGVVSGARLGRPSDSNAVAGECGLSRSRPDAGGSQRWVERCFRQGSRNS